MEVARPMAAKKKPGKKYEHLKGTVPEVPQVAPGIDKRADAIRAFQDGNPRAQAMEAAVREGRELTAKEAAFPEGPRKDWTVDQLTREYNALEETDKKVSQMAAILSIQMEANERLIGQKIQASGADRVTINGFTWSPNSQPFPSVDDSTALVKHYIDNNLTAMLSVHHSRVLSTVKEEIEANTLQVVIKEKAGPNGEDVTEIRSNLPGVKVFLKPCMSRTKASVGVANMAHQEESNDE
jgi:hypothetical protein